MYVKGGTSTEKLLEWWAVKHFQGAGRKAIAQMGTGRNRVFIAVKHTEKDYTVYWNSHHLKLSQTILGILEIL